MEGKGKLKNGEILQVVLFPFHALELVPWVLEWAPALLKEHKEEQRNCMRIPRKIPVKTSSLTGTDAGKGDDDGLST